MTTLADHLRALGACDPAVEWVAAQPDQRPEALWAACHDGSWMLWALERAGIDCSELGYVCAERARQSALRALPLSPERDALAACAPITDRATAEEAARALAALTAGCAASPVARAAEWAARATAARAARAAEWAARAEAWAAEWVWAEAAAKAEFAAIADLVRERWTVPPREVIEMLGGWR